MDGKLVCVECGTESDHLARGWMAVRCEDPDGDAAPELAFYCSLCTWVEFGVDLRRRPLTD
jgi:hypothetical protein